MFAFLVVNVNTIENPVYKATCINGYGHGYGKDIKDASDNCTRQVANLMDICNQINLSIDLVSKETWMSQTNPETYGLTSWDSDAVFWVEIDIETIMKKEDLYVRDNKTLAS